jgi:hypothetical protein
VVVVVVDDDDDVDAAPAVVLVVAPSRRPGSDVTVRAFVVVDPEPAGVDRETPLGRPRDVNGAACVAAEAGNVTGVVATLLLGAGPMVGNPTLGTHGAPTRLATTNVAYTTQLRATTRPTPTTHRARRPRSSTNTPRTCGSATSARSTTSARGEP